MYSAKAWSRPFLLILLCFATLIAEPAVNQKCIASALPDTGPPRRLHVLIYELKGICHEGLAEGEMHFLSREASRLHLLPITGCHIGAFSQLTSLELSAWDLGNLSQLPSFAGLVSASRSSVGFKSRMCAVVCNILALAWCSVLGYPQTSLPCAI